MGGLSKAAVCVWLLFAAALVVPRASPLQHAADDANGAEYATAAAGPGAGAGPLNVQAFEEKMQAKLGQFAHLRAHHNHSDHFRDTFPMAMTPGMHKRVLKLRNLMRSQDNELTQIRGDRVVGAVGWWRDLPVPCAVCPRVLPPLADAATTTLAATRRQQR
jgi:hypothetical protein